jgi:hypothetical protein
VNLVYAKPKTQGSQVKFDKDSFDRLTTAAYLVKRDPLIDGLMALDHARDMGETACNYMGFPRPDPTAIGVAELRWDFQPSYNCWKFTDDRGLQINISEDVLIRGERIVSSPRGAFFVGPCVDKLRRFISIKDDRGVVYQFDMSRHGVARAPIPPNHNVSNKFSINKQGGAIMAQAKEVTEKPIQQQTVKLGVYFRVNDLPQELTQKQTVEHAAKLLTLGASEVKVQRFIRDETSAQYTNKKDYI